MEIGPNPRDAVVASHRPPQSQLGYEVPGAPSAPPIVTSRSSRIDANVGALYVDDYNANLQNQYNNAYNYWLWQKQMEYNSPKAQVARLREAGLNPNFNSIEGTGNASSIPASQASLPGNIGKNRLNAISTGVSIATALATGISRGVGALKTIATTPLAIRNYRELLNQVLGQRFSGSLLDNDLKRLQLSGKSWLMGFNGDEQIVPFEETLWGRSQLAQTGLQEFNRQLAEKKVRYQDLLNGIKEWEKDNYNPQKLDNLKATWENITAGTTLRQINIDWYNAAQATAIVRALAPLILKLL